MSISVMQLEACKLSSLAVSTRQDAVVPPGTLTTNEMVFNIDVRPHKTERKFRVGCELEITWPEDALSHFDRVQVGVIGVFSFPAGTDEATVSQYVPLLCASNLIGVMRGIVAQATSMCNGGPYIIPLVNVHELMKNPIGGESQPAEVSDCANQ